MYEICCGQNWTLVQERSRNTSRFFFSGGIQSKQFITQVTTQDTSQIIKTPQIGA